MTGALGSTFIAARYWPSFAVGAALAGFPIVIGENVVGIDKKSVIKNGKTTKAPELERRIEYFTRYFDGYGAMIIQMNVEDTRNGVAEFLIDKYGNDVIIELKWGQGAKDIGGEIQVADLEYAQFLKNRRYIVDPDPFDPVVIKGFENRAITSFAREDHLFKALSLCTPYAKLICLGRAPMIAGFLGSNIEGVFYPERKASLNGHWDVLPPSVTEYGKYPEEIFSFAVRTGRFLFVLY